MLLKENLMLRLLSLRIPTFMFIGPRIVALDDEGCAVEIPLTWRTKNHLIGAMYFGVLCAGADLAGGLPAAKLIFGKHKDVKLVFAEMHAEFLKRADGDVVFRSRDGRRIAAAVERTARTGERVSEPVEVIATVPKKYGEEPVARFRMTISLKRSGAATGAAPSGDGAADRAAAGR